MLMRTMLLAGLALALLTTLMGITTRHKGTIRLGDEQIETMPVHQRLQERRQPGSGMSQQTALWAGAPKEAGRGLGPGHVDPR